jgi:hypothetical protein
MKRRALLVVVAVTILAGMRTKDEGGRFKGGIEPSIARVLSGGTWSSGGDSGTCRVVVQDLGWEQTRSYLFLQWLKVDDGRREVTEFKTVPVAEFNEGDWANVTEVRHEKEGFVIDFILRSGEQAGKIRAQLRPRGPGQYEFHVDKK